MAFYGIYRHLFLKGPVKLFALNNNFIPNVRFNSSVTDNFKYIKLTKAGARNNVGIITLSRPEALNALCDALIDEVTSALDILEDDSSVGAIIITGSGKAFAAGADIKELSSGNLLKYYGKTLIGPWDRISQTVKPLIAAVNGYAFGGGSEVAMMCDIIYASENAKFGQQEILYGLVPGAGASQLLPRLVGKSKAMEIILTGNPFSAQEAERMGLVSKVFPGDKLLEETVKLGEKIASNSQIINRIAKQCINSAFQTTLQEGLHFEKRMFHGTFSTEDQKEGMSAFVEKRPPNFINK